jgi:squalene synthase HpnC
VDSPFAIEERTWSTEEAYAFCAGMARTHYENFTVGSFLLPKDKLRHMHAIYGFCRLTDDLGDEASGDRIALLDKWENDLRLCYSATPNHPVMVALQDTVTTFDIPQRPFAKLIEANRMDQRQQRYPTYDDLLHYCDHSANPVGHMVLYLFGYRDEERRRLSDFTCTALQLTNFWQDVARDFRKGRIYIPLEDMENYGYVERELAQNVVNDSFRRLMEFEVDRTEGLFRQGRPLMNMVDGVFRQDLALFTLGGREVLKKIRQQRYDVLGHRPTLSRGRKAWLLVSTWLRFKLGLGTGSS